MPVAHCNRRGFSAENQVLLPAPSSEQAPHGKKNPVAQAAGFFPSVLRCSSSPNRKRFAGLRFGILKLEQANPIAKPAPQKTEGPPAFRFRILSSLKSEFEICSPPKRILRILLPDSVSCSAGRSLFDLRWRSHRKPDSRDTAWGWCGASGK